MDVQQTPIEPLTVSVAEAKRLSGLGTTKIYELMLDGRLLRRKVDGRTLIEFSSLKKLLTSAPEAKSP